MDELQFLGLAIGAIITLGAFVGVIMKFIQPINELRLAIQKLTDYIDAMKADDKNRDDRIKNHDEQLDKLHGRVGKLETRMSIYHKD